MSVVGQYGGNENEPTLGIFSLLWKIVQSFTNPLSRLVPDASKVRGGSQCYDLMACEAHRLGQLMGPTAENIANLFRYLISFGYLQKLLLLPHPRAKPIPPTRLGILQGHHNH